MYLPVSHGKSPERWQEEPGGDGEHSVQDIFLVSGHRGPSPSGERGCFFISSNFAGSLKMYSVRIGSVTFRIPRGHYSFHTKLV